MHNVIQTAHDHVSGIDIAGSEVCQDPRIKWHLPDVVQTKWSKFFGMPDGWSRRNFEILSKPDVCLNKVDQSKGPIWKEFMYIVPGSNPI